MAVIITFAFSNNIYGSIALKPTTIAIKRQQNLFKTTKAKTFTTTSKQQQQQHNNNNHGSYDNNTNNNDYNRGWKRNLES